MAKKLQELLSDIALKSNRVNELFDAADKRGDGVNTTAEIDEIKSCNKQIEEWESEAAELKSIADLRRGNDERMKAHQQPVPPIPFQVNNGGPQVQTYKSAGFEFTENADMANFLKQFEGRSPSNGIAIQSPRVEMKTLITGASATSGGALVFPDRKPIVDAFFQRPLTVRDIITNGETNSDTVEYVRVTSVTNAAAPVPEATSVSDGSKPESAMALARVTESVKTIAHWVPITNRALADGGQIRTMVDNFLRYGLEEELEDQILTGTGTDNFTGVLVAANTTAQAWDTNILTTTRKGRTKVRTTGRANPTAYVMHPNDWQTIDLLQDNEARYYFGGPARPGQPMLWGLPVVESEGMTAGTCVVADWRLAVLWDRMQTAISMSNSHSDYFVKNLVAILAEMRAAFGILRPQAFVICDLTA